MMLCLKICIIINIQNRLIVSGSSCSSRFVCLTALHFVITMYTHHTHTYMIMLCSIFANYNRMLVVHLVVASKMDAALKTQSWPPFVHIYVTSRKVRWIILSLEIHRLCMITRLILLFFSHDHACLYSNKRTYCKKQSLPQKE